MRPPRRCLYVYCNALVHGSYCPAHKPYGVGWARTRRLALERDRYTCWNCGGQATTADHIIQLSQGGTDTLGNLRAACRACNTRRGGV